MTTSEDGTSARLLRRTLDRHDASAGKDPFSNPFLGFALDCAGRAADEAGLAGMADAVQELTAEAFSARAERLGAYLDGADPEKNIERLEALFDDLADRGGPEGYVASVERAGFGLVLTGHPTFALNRELSLILVELATGRVADGAPLDDAGRSQRMAQVRAVRHGPPEDLTLDAEHEWSLVALGNAWCALEQAIRAALRVGRRRWPAEWTGLTPQLLTLATWVGFDQDGRTDVTWLVSFDKRLSLKRAALEQYRRMLAPLLQAAAPSPWCDAVLALANRIQTAQAAVTAQGGALSACRADPSRLSEFAQAMVRSAAAALTDAGELLQLVQTALAGAPDEAATETLLVIKSLLRSQGLSLAHVHVRLNAGQLHSAVQSQVGLDTAPSDPAHRRSYFAAIEKLIAEAKPARINFGDLAEEPSSARRLMMTVAQMGKFIDASSPVRFLIAETESGFTLLAALYLARLFGVENRVEISPLYETEQGLADGERLIEEALRSPHYRAYLQRQGRLAIEFGFSDSGRFIGQMSATFRIERLRLRLADLLQAQGLSGLEVVFFNTHGESIGRGGHPDSLSDRFRYAAPPRSRAEYRSRGIRTVEEDSFQGGEGYLPLLTPIAALATVRAALHFALAPDPEAEGDPIYEEEDFSSEFFASVQQSFSRLVHDPDYTALLGLYGINLLPRTGSRPVQRQAGDAGVPRPLGSVSELRAIPNNGLLQQLGYLANTIYGVGPAAARNPETFERMCATSPRFRRALRMVEAANDLSDLKATRAYAAVFDPTMWLERAAAAADPLAEDQRLSRAAERAQSGERLAGASRELMADALCLPKDLRPRADERRARLRLLHALRCALIQRVCLLAAELPELPVGALLTREDLRARLMRLDIPWALHSLRAMFPPQQSSGQEGADFGEPSDYHADVSQSHRDEHERLIEPLEQLFDLCLRISTALTHEIGACG